MSPYLVTAIVFGLLLAGVYFYLSLPRTVYIPGRKTPDESVEASKARAAKVRSRQFVFGVGGVIGLCLLTMLGIFLVDSAKIVYAAKNPSPTPSVTPTRTASPTPRATNTPRPTNTPAQDNFLTTIAQNGTPAAPGTMQSARTPSATPKPGLFAPSGGGGGGVVQNVYVVQTKIVTQPVYILQTQIVQVPVTVIVVWTPTMTPTPLPTATVDTPTATLSPTPTFTPEPPTPTATFTETPTP